jgi:undecaprenyl-diphosphatase
MADRAGSTAPATAQRPTIGWVVLGLSLALLALSALAARSGVSTIERAVLDTVFAIGGPTEWALWLPMQLGSVTAPFIVSLVTGAIVGWHRWRAWAGPLVAGLTAWWLAQVVKGAVGRGRPADALADFSPRSSAPSDGLGFPSGHAAVAFALATALVPYLPRRSRVLVFALAAVVAMARVHLGAHLPLDVIGGAALGVAVGTGWHLVVGVAQATAATDPEDVSHG